jgi:hypothetical protein
VALDGWDIDPTKVQAIVSTASGRTEGFEKDFPALGTALSEMATASKSGPVMEALNGWAEKTVQPGLESKPENCARYTGSPAIVSRAGFPGRCASPVVTREGRAALVADVYRQWMPGASPVAAQNASVLFQNSGNPGDPQVQAILKTLPDHGG